MPENTFCHLVWGELRSHWYEWAQKVGAKKFVVGISGGVDSTVVATLACRLFGEENVIGVSMPCNGQKDIEDVNEVFKFLPKMKRVDIDIGDMFANLKDKLDANSIVANDVVKTNAPARLRMTTLFAVGQALNAFVLNTCNLSEDMVGYSTFGGDNFGTYAPIRWLTKTEVKLLGRKFEIPEKLLDKTPIDGLQPMTDEEKLGFTYESLDRYIRTGFGVDSDTEKKICNMFMKNKFKLDIVNLPGPEFKFLPNWIFYYMRNHM